MWESLSNFVTSIILLYIGSKSNNVKYYLQLNLSQYSNRNNKQSTCYQNLVCLFLEYACTVCGSSCMKEYFSNQVSTRHTSIIDESQITTHEILSVSDIHPSLYWHMYLQLPLLHS